MRFSPRLLALLPLSAALLAAAQLQSSKSYAQRAGAAPDPVAQLPAPPASNPAPGTLGGPVTSALPAKPIATPAPNPVVVPVLVSMPVPMPTPKNAIRVGLSTQGSAIQIWTPRGATLRDAGQNGRTQSVPAGATLSFISGPSFSQKIGAQTFRGPISVQINGRISQGWTQIAVLPLGDEFARATSNGKSPRYGRPYRGSFEVFPQRLPEPNHRKGSLALVNVLGLEEYLKGVVPWEMDAIAPLEALKAQAICARSETLDFKQTGKFKAGGFDICDYDACQGYPGTENENPATTRAVESTRGLALFQNGRPIDAVYSTNSGGITAASSDVWRGGDVPYLQSVRDFPADSPLANLFRGGMNESKWAQFVSQPFPSFAQPSGLKSSSYEARKYRWSQFVSVEEATKAFAAQGLAVVTNIEVQTRAQSGRIRRIKVEGTDAASLKISAAPSSQLPPGGAVLGSSATLKTVVLEGDGAIRSMFSKQLGSTTALPSSLFVVTPKTNTRGEILGWTFSGAGWGHGVGMCQRGAQNHARDGWDARRILNWYYRGVQILPIGN
jgi:SpoIID/LytB domain protein